MESDVLFKENGGHLVRSNDTLILLINPVLHFTPFTYIDTDFSFAHMDTYLWITSMLYVVQKMITAL